MIVMGPLPTSDRSNKYIPIMMDYFSKWAEAVPLPNQEAPTVAEALMEMVVCRFRAPSEIHTDQGRNFQAHLFRELLRLLGVPQTRTCALRPQSDGMVERANRTVEQMLEVVVAKDQRDWDFHLHLALAAYRASRHKTTGASPNVVVLGRDPKPGATALSREE